eukprot:CAMPEP_0180655422 /NCGR_PEP_ID=MMETSP1037_2-20121125/55260_1 /TAXON_ID=632150 /ORGANISM="Azadinium spinosum, Strain 3D9" /LENGTH=67 /DNA_ID=CAMNT_0022681837 /DNA_START=199 /DNA_END=398 /DNA_ORIENTATION=-
MAAKREVSSVVLQATIPWESGGGICLASLAQVLSSASHLKALHNLSTAVASLPTCTTGNSNSSFQKG